MTSRLNRLDRQQSDERYGTFTVDELGAIREMLNFVAENSTPLQGISVQKPDPRRSSFVRDLVLDASLTLHGGGQMSRCRIALLWRQTNNMLTN